MNNKDEKLIAGYMGWEEDELLVGYCIAPDRTAHFNLNDAGLCVKKMQRQEDWDDFLDYVETCTNKRSQEWSRQLIAWLFNADNFFEAMAKWLKEKR